MHDNYICGVRGMNVVHSDDVYSNNDRFDILGDNVVRNTLQQAILKLSFAMQGSVTMFQKIKYTWMRLRVVLTSRLAWTIAEWAGVAWVIWAKLSEKVTRSSSSQAIPNKYGLRVRRLQGEKAKLCSYEGHSEEVTFAADGYWRDLIVHVNPISNLYKMKEAWLEWPDDEPGNTEQSLDDDQPEAEPDAECLVAG